MSRAAVDDIAWQVLHAKVPLIRRASSSARPGNFRQVGERLADGAEFEVVWGDFLHEFYTYQTADFFAEPPPASLSRKRRALLAGTAEFLSDEFCLNAPSWVNDPEYTLPALWDAAEDFFPYPDMSAFRDERAARTHPPFLKRNIIFLTRNLIAV